MRKFLMMILPLLTSLCLYGQPKEVTLVVAGEGNTKEDATNNALRSAVEQAFGVFVSANTEILNDELVRDEIAMVSTGNISSFEELSAERLPSGLNHVSLKTTVSIGKLITYAKSHGSAAEFAGNTFAANLRLRELNKANEEMALRDLVQLIHSMAPQMFDFALIPDDNPKYDQEYNGYVFNLGIIVAENEQSKNVYQAIRSTLTSLNLSEKERQEYKNNNLPFTSFTINQDRFWLRGDEETLTEFTSAFKSAIVPAIFDISISTQPTLSVNYQIYCNIIEKINSYTEMGRSLPVASSYSNFIGHVKVSDTESRDFLWLLLDHRDHGWGFSYHDYNQDHIIFVPGWESSNQRYPTIPSGLSMMDRLKNRNMNNRNDNNNSKRRGFVCEYSVPILIKTTDLSKITQFVVQRTEGNS